MLVKSKRRQREINKLVEAAERVLGLVATNDEVLAFLLGRRAKVDRGDIFNARGADRGCLCPLCSTELTCAVCQEPPAIGLVTMPSGLLDSTAIGAVENALANVPYETRRLAIKTLQRLR